MILRVGSWHNLVIKFETNQLENIKACRLLVEALAEFVFILSWHEAIDVIKYGSTDFKVLRIIDLYLVSNQYDYVIVIKFVFSI